MQQPSVFVLTVPERYVLGQELRSGTIGCRLLQAQLLNQHMWLLLLSCSFIDMLLLC
jgi:hypothetical protein